MKCCIINLNRSPTAASELKRRAYDIDFITEPPAGPKGTHSLFSRGKTVHSGTGTPRAALRYSANLKAWPVPAYTKRDIATVAFLYRGKVTYLASYYAHKDVPLRGSELEKLVQYCCRNKIPLLLGGDFNAKSRTWGSKITDARGLDLEDLMSEYGLLSENKGSVPTFSGAPGESVIDILFTNTHYVGYISSWMVDVTPSCSDHRYVTFAIGDTEIIQTESRNLKKGNWDLFRSSFRVPTISDVDLTTPEGIDRAADELEAEITAALDVACRKRRVTVRAKDTQPWWTPELEECRGRMMRLWAIHRASRTSLRKRVMYKNALNEYRWRLRNSKTDTFREKTSGLNTPKEISDMLKSMDARPAKVIGLLSGTDGTTAGTAEESLQILMRTHFPECEPLSDVDLIPAPQVLIPLGDAEFITQRMVGEAIQSFGPNKAAGPDEFKPRILQELPEEAIGVLTRIYKSCIIYGYVPKAWGKMRVAFIPKPGKDSYETPKSYRPITLSNFILKALERVVQWELSDRIGQLESQHAYTAGLSCDTALSVVADEIESSIYRGQYTLAVSLDCTGAFDNIRFASADRAMAKAGVEDNIRRWYVYLLNNRRVTADVQGAKSTVRPTRGSPQGGVLSPLIWNLIMDELLTQFRDRTVKAVGYADDVMLLVSGPCIETLRTHMEGALEKVLTWGDENGLTFNPSKTQCVLFRNGTNCLKMKPLKMRGTTLELEKSLKYLGVTFTQRLFWTKHVAQQLIKCRKILHMARKMVGKTWGLTPSKILWIYTAIVRPTLSYGCLIWAHKIPKTLVDSLRRLQRMCIKLMMPCLRSTPTAGLEVMLGIKPLELHLLGEALKARVRTKRYVIDNWDGTARGRRTPHRSTLDKLLKRVPESKKQVDWIDRTREWHFSPNREIEKETIAIYTDGSHENGRTGAGLCFCKGDEVVHEDMVYLGNQTSVFQAEISAIYMALLYITTHKEKLSSETAVIHTDSQASVMALGNSVIRSLLVYNTVQMMKEAQMVCPIDIRWIKGHADNTGNEVADALAKAGAAGKGGAVKVPLPTYAVRDGIDRLISNRWQKQWDERKDCAHSKMMMPHTPMGEGKRKQYMKYDKQTLAKLAQWFTGHCLLGRHMSHWKDISSFCRLCAKGYESPIHLLEECEMLDREQKLLANLVHDGKSYEMALLVFTRTPLVAELLYEDDGES